MTFPNREIETEFMDFFVMDLCMAQNHQKTKMDPPPPTHSCYALVSVLHYSQRQERTDPTISHPNPSIPSAITTLIQSCMSDRKSLTSVLLMHLGTHRPTCMKLRSCSRNDSQADRVIGWGSFSSFEGNIGFFLMCSKICSVGELIHFQYKLIFILKSKPLAGITER